MPRKAASTAPPGAVTPPGKRDPTSGKFTLSPKAKLMRQNSYEGFRAWYDDRQPRILTKGKYEHVSLTDKQERTLKRILQSDKKGGFQYSLSVIIWPRRHSKSTMLKLICLWLIDTRDHLTVQVWGNGEAHSRRVQFQPICRIIEQTPSLRKKIVIQRSEIIHDVTGSRILPAVGNSVVFGDKIDVLYIDDYHACPDVPAVNALQAALLDQPNSLMLVGSNVDPIDGHVHALQKLAAEDPGIFCDHLEYVDWCHYESAAPSWIDRAKAKRLEKTTLPSEFERDILGKRSQAVNSLFDQKDIERCKMAYKIPVTQDIKTLIQGRTCKIGAGLDRAKDLFGEATKHDNTILTFIAKVAKHDGEPEFFILDQSAVVPNTAQHIKILIRQAHDRYKLDNLVLEDFGTSDLDQWCAEQQIPSELANAHSNRQNAIFPELSRIIREGRLHFPADMTDLISEMQGFQYKALSGGKNYEFGAAGKGHDDRVYSLAWSIYSLRAEVMSVYTIENVCCSNRGKARPFCVLLGGDAELSCSHGCGAFQQVKDMHRDFKKFNTESHLDVCMFYRKYVKVTGSLIYQAA